MNGFGRGDKNQNKNKTSVITRETVGMTLLLFSAVLLLIAVVGKYMFGSIGVAITAFLLGLTGYLTYPLLVLLIYLSVVMVFGKKLFSAKWLALGSALVACVFLIVHLATSTRFLGSGYGGYLGGCWNAAAEGASGATGGGVVFGLIVYPVQAVLSTAGAYVVFSFLLVLALFFILRATPLKKYVSRSVSEKRSPRPAREEVPSEQVKSNGVKAYPASVAFDDLPPARPSAPQYVQQSERYAQPRASAPASERGEGNAYRRDVYTAPEQQPAPVQTSRDILFNSDPAASYRNNLIYDRDSYFNSHPRRSSETVSQSAEQSYLGGYSRQAETARPPMPRKITEEKNVPESGYSYPLRAEDDLNYPQRPSYKAAEPAPEAHPRDFYANDVPYEEEFSSAPNAFDEAPVSDAPADVPPQYAEPERFAPAEEPARPFDRFARNEQPAEPERFTPAEEPARPFDRFARSEQPAEPERFTRREQPFDPVPEPFEKEETAPRAFDSFSRTEEDGSAEQSRAREAEFRNLFSRPSETIKTELPETGGRMGFGDAFGQSAELPEESAPAEEPPAPVRKDTIRKRVNPLALEPQAEEEEDEQIAESRVFEAPVRGETRSAVDMFDSDEPEEEEIYDEPVIPDAGRSRGGFTRTPSYEAPAQEIPSAPVPAPKKHVYKAYRHPSVELFHQYDDSVSVSQEEIERNSSIIVETLAGFRVDAEVVKVTSGSAVTRYDIDIPRNIAVRSVIKHDEEIAMRLHSRDGVNMYSNSEIGAISIEVPNSKRATVGIRSVLQADEYVNAKPTALMFAIGKDVEGRNVCGNIAKMKHILVAGSTGSGKSVCLNAMLISLITKYSPQELRLILIDPKKVEFAIYDGLPHLMINEIIADAQKAVTALNWSIKEMERRYLLFEQKTRAGKLVHNLDEYNASVTEDEDKLPKIVIVVDELADLMSVAKKDIEDRIQRLAQKARAAGIHLVIATQRPSVDVITGVIKGNLPTRMAFRVIQEVDSRTIIDSSGAEKLLGNGDMLYRTEGMFSCSRVQGAFLSSDEVQSVVEEIKANNEAYFDSDIADYINKTESAESPSDMADDGGDGSVDPQYIKALGIVVKLGSASISLIQRKCSVGYNHAGKIIEWMEVMGYISPFDGKAKARTVLLTKEEYESKYGSLD